MTSSDVVLDNILLQVGDIGKHQVVVISCLCLVILLHAATHMAYVFTSMDSDYRCLIPECEDKISADPGWLKEVVPYKYTTYDQPFKCLMYNRVDNSSAENNKLCLPSEFDRTTVIQCTSHFFNDDEFYLGREFNLLCENNLWLLSLVGSANTAGMFIGLMVTGFISDRYGRKPLLLIGISLCGLIGLMKTFSPSFYWFLVFELIEACCSAGVGCCVFIIGVELVVPNRRSLITSILNTSYCFGEVLVAVVAWICRYWKSLIYYTYGPCAILILLYWTLPESVRWMLSKGKLEESKQLLTKIAKENRKKLSEESLKTLERTEFSRQNSHKFMTILRSKCLCWRFLNCCFGWATCAFLFYGITLNSVTLYGNKYVDFILISLTELPANWICIYMVENLGRRKSICGSYFLTAVACLCFTISSKFSAWFSLFVYCMGKFGATVAFTVIYIITSEIFPTSLRHTVMGLCSTVGRLGSITSPQTPLLGQIWGPLPLVLFATMSTLAGLLSLFFPETKGIKLPDTIEEAEAIK